MHKPWPMVEFVFSKFSANSGKLRSNTSKNSRELTSPSVTNLHNRPTEPPAASRLLATATNSGLAPSRTESNF